MRKYLFLFTFLLLSAKSFAQDKDFNYKFYGQIRTDFYYNSRANEETVDGLFYMYPKDKVYDATGKDLNATANGSFYTLYTRLEVPRRPLHRCQGRRHHAGPHQRPHPHLFRSGERSVHRGQQPHQLL